MKVKHWWFIFFSGLFGWIGTIQSFGGLPQFSKWDDLLLAASSVILLIISALPLEDYLTQKAIRKLGQEPVKSSFGSYVNNLDRTEFAKAERWLWAPFIVWLFPVILCFGQTLTRD